VMAGHASVALETRGCTSRKRREAGDREGLLAFSRISPRLRASPEVAAA
jgi:hypothetical protein